MSSLPASLPAAAVQQQSKACLYLLGERPLPSNPIPDETPAGGYSQVRTPLCTCWPACWQ